MLDEAQEQRIVRAIANAERGNRGEVRVHLERHCPVGDPLIRAKALYRQLGLARTQDDTAVLLYVATGSRVAAVYSGAGIYGQAEDGFWRSVTDAVAAGYRDGQPATGLVNALDLVGELLRRQVPGEDSAGNELPDAVTTGSLDGSADRKEVS